MLADDPLWYKDAIVYQLHVKAFCDSTNDGIGDFQGLSQKLDYVKDLGVTAIWLLPFYPSPLRDDGYDIANYKAINPAYGAMRDFRRFVREAHHRGLRVITELVINHTSGQHPWFQRARRAKPGSAWRNYYVWSDTDRKYKGTRIIFTDTETSNWAWDPVAKAYYWHRFFSHQPDLNFDNPRVLDAILKVMKFWLDKGVDGLRLDAVPYLCEREGTNNENLPETHAVLQRMRAWLAELRGTDDLDAEALAAFSRRVEAYMVKAVREAKVESSWANPTIAYEEAVSGFVQRILLPGERNLFLADFLPFQARVARLGVFHSLAQTALKLTSPGVPDTYQGCELWDLNLVDPDNRRPVDYGRRAALLGELREAFGTGARHGPEKVRSLVDHWQDGRAKLFLIWRLLQLRRAQSSLFSEGAYVPVATTGEMNDHVCAFAREHDNPYWWPCRGSLRSCCGGKRTCRWAPKSGATQRWSWSPTGPYRGTRTS